MGRRFLMREKQTAVLLLSGVLFKLGDSLDATDHVPHISTPAMAVPMHSPARGASVPMHSPARGAFIATSPAVSSALASNPRSGSGSMLGN